MGFSDELRRKGAPIWDREHSHPFVTGIGDGSLSLDQFKYYMRQDYLFLVDFSRAVALAAAKARTLEDMGWFARLMHETLNTEMALHVGFCGDFGISEEELRSTSASPTTLAYTRFLLQTAFSQSAGVIASAILPCSWGYSEIGQMLYDRGLPEEQPLLARWIEMYNAPEFAELGGLAPLVHRPRGGGERTARTRTDGIGVHPGQPVRVHVLGRGLPHGGVASLAGPSFGPLSLRERVGVRARS